MFSASSSHLPQRKVALAIADALLVPGAIMLTVALGFGSTTFRAEVGGHATTLLLLWLVIFPTFYFFGLYDTERLQDLRSGLLPALGCAALAGLFDAVFLRAALPSSRALAGGLLVTGLIFVSIVLARLAHRVAAQRGLLSSRALVVGTPEQVREIADLLASHPHSGLQVIGMVDLGGDGWEAASAYPRLGGLADLDRLALSLRVDCVVLGAGLEKDAEILRRLRPVRYRGTEILAFVSLFERLAQEISIAHIDDAWLFSAAMNSSRLHARWLKRLLDVVASALLLVPAGLLVLPLAALAIKLTSRGPVFFFQERLGLGAQPFMVVKLRTMRTDAEALTGPVWSTDSDPRITSIGRILRKFRVDELPQLWNVLVGEMSMIGPRPERGVFVRELSARLPLFSERLLVRPGITGWAQVMAPYASTVSDSYRKLQFDLYYAKHMSPWLDGLIIVKTVKTMLLGREREQGGLAAGRQAANLDLGNAPVAAITVKADEQEPVRLPMAG